MSLGFFVLELVLSAGLFVRNRHAADRWVLPLALTIAGMEGLEAVMWLTGPPEWSEAAPLVGGRCGAGNRLATVVGGVLLWLQPACACLFGWRSSSSNREGFRVLLVLSAVTFVAAMAHLPGSFSPSQGFSQDALSSRLLSIADETCTMEGPGGHLMWRFSASLLSLVLLPNQFVYFLLFFLPLVLFYRPFSLGGVLGLVMCALLTITFAYLRSAEAFSVFCWQGLFVHLWVLFYPYLFPQPQHSHVE